MLDLNFIKENRDLVQSTIEARNMKVDLNRFFELLEDRNLLIQKVDELKAKRNKFSEEIPKLDENSKVEAIAKVGDLKKELKTLEPDLAKIQSEFKTLWLEIPNLMADDVPLGKVDEDNKEIYRSVEEVTFDFEPKDHTELLGDDLLDFERAAKVTGAKFYYLKNDLALLERALIQYVIDIVVNKHDFEFLSTPDLAKNEVILGTGFNPRGEEKQIYNIEGEEISLIGTSEITLGAYHSADVFAKEELPKKYLGLSHCFRMEAGTYGRTSKGLYRVHQFSKLEMFIFSTPEQSKALLEELKDIEKEIFDNLEIPYRIVNICSGDLGAPAYKKYDLEAWMVMAAKNEDEKGGWGEITSCSNCTDYQARRLNIKYKDGNEKLFVHTLNGTAISLARAIVAFVENHQNEDGSINVPEVLRPYIFGKEIINK